VKLKFNKKSSTKVIARAKNKVKIRKKINGSQAKPRLSVYRSTKHVYAQLIDDVNGKTLVAASSLSLGSKNNKNGSKAVGQEIAKLALAKNIKNVVFDRSGYLYHGRIQAIADGAREAGLNF